MRTSLLQASDFRTSEKNDDRQKGLLNILRQAIQRDSRNREKEISRLLHKVYAAASFIWLICLLCAFCAFCRQVLIGMFVVFFEIVSSIVAFREPRSRFTGACGGRGLSDLACLQTAGLYERLSSARVTERVRLPLAIQLGVDKPVHGQRTSITDLDACPHHAHSLLHTPAVNGVLKEDPLFEQSIFVT